MFGGTFDPVHVGHVVAASEARWALGLDRVLLVVAADPWQKRGDVVAPAADRLDLVRAAVDGIAGLEASDVEVARGGPSVTADTLEALGAPGRDLVLILGADAAAGLGTWRRGRPARPGDARGGRAGRRRPGARPVRWPGARPGVDGGAGRDTPPRRVVDRRAGRVASGRPIHGLVPPAVAELIRTRGLYTRP